QERGFGTVRYGAQVGKDFNYRVYEKYFDRSHSYHANGNDNDAWQMGQGGFRSDWDATSRDSLTLQGDLYKGQTGQSIAVATYTPPYSQTITQNGDLFGANILGRWKRQLSPTSDTALQWYYDRTNRTDLNFSEYRDTADLDFQHHFVWAWQQELTWGFGY